MKSALKVCLVAMLTASVALAVVPIADAKRTAKVSHKKQNKKIRKAQREADRAHERIQDLKAWNFGLGDKNLAQDETINGVASTVNAIVAGVPDIIGGLQALEEGLLALQAALENDVAPALEAIDAALNDTTTGLVGLNLARPQFGVFGADGSFLGGTGTVAAGPDGPATKGGLGPPDLEGAYVVDFNNDVSARMYSVTQFAGGPGTTPLTVAAANCSTPGIDTLCGLVQLGAPDNDPNKVFVKFGNGETPPPTAFNVVATSG